MTHQISIVGLGNYGLDDLPLGVYRFFTSAIKNLRKNEKTPRTF